MPRNRTPSPHTTFKRPASTHTTLKRPASQNSNAEFYKSIQTASIVSLPQKKRSIDRPIDRPTDRPTERTNERTNERTTRRSVRLKRTNLRVRGLSLNRSQQWTALLRTTPRLRTRSSTNDLAPLHRM